MYSIQKLSVETHLNVTSAITITMFYTNSSSSVRITCKTKKMKITEKYSFLF